jgi:lysophospholipase L1-like esterase
MKSSVPQTPTTRPSAPRGCYTALLLVAATSCILLALNGCGGTLRSDNYGVPAAGSPTSTPSVVTSGPTAVTPSDAATAPPAIPAASQTKAPAVSASYIPAEASASTASIYLQGDSLTVPITGLLARLLPRDTLTISAKNGRPLRIGLSLLTQRAKNQGLPQVVVMEMGSNDDPAMPSAFARMINQTMTVIGSDRCAVWVDLYQRATKKVGKKLVAYNVYDRLNNVISTASARYKNLAVVPWATTARRHRSWFGPDGVHPSDAGSAVFAQMIAAAVDNCKKGGLPSLEIMPDPSGGVAPPS